MSYLRPSSMMSTCWLFWLLTLTHTLPVHRDLFSSTRISLANTDKGHLEERIFDPSENHGASLSHRLLPSAEVVYRKYALVKHLLADDCKERAETNDKIFQSFLVSQNLDHALDPNGDAQTSARGDFRMAEEWPDGATEKDSPTPGYYQSFKKCRPGSDHVPGLLSSVGLCPDKYSNDSIRHLCENDIDLFGAEDGKQVIRPYFMPVSDDRLNVFANRYCALCHGASGITSWKFAFECETTDLEKFDENTQNASVRTRLKNCGLKAFPPFPLNSNACDAVSPTKLHRRKRGQRSRDDKSDQTDIHFPVSFSILMNFGFDGKTHILFSEAHHILQTPVDISPCPQNQIFDPEKRICRPVVCDEGYVLKNQKCVKDLLSKPTFRPPAGDGIKADDIAQVSLEVNVSLADYFLMLSNDFPRLMRAEIGSLFNISISRIQNVTIERLSGHGTGNILEIHKYKEKMGRRTRARNPHDSHTKNEDIYSQITAIQNTDMRVSEFLNTKELFHGILTFLTIYDRIKTGRKHTESVRTTTKSFLDVTENNESFKDTSEYYASSNGTNKNNASFINDGKNNESYVDTVEVEEDFTTTEDKLQLFSNTRPITQEFQKPAEIPLATYIVKISFLLFPPSDEAIEETSVGDAVEEMANMVNDKSFKMKVNNTRISVVNIINEGEPFSIYSGCTHGVINGYDDKHFHLRQVVNQKTGENETVIYVNETGDMYMRGQYDLMVLMQGSFMDSRDSNVSGYVLVCTMPRIVDKSCGTILLGKDEYWVVNHDKAIVDIYTHTQRSIYEYRRVGNDSVEICMPNLANKSCGRIQLGVSEYQMLQNKSIVYAGEFYNIFQYEKSGNGSVEICIPKNYLEDISEANVTDHVTGCDLAQYKVWLKAEVYLTATLSMISILSMSIVLLTYGLFPKLRNLPGTNTMNLTLALLIAEMVFEFGSSSEIHGVCVAVGVALHFFFLASFFWMNVMAYDVYRTFANSCVLTRVRSKSKYQPRYALYAWGCPALVVMMCCFLDFTCVIQTINIGYGPKLPDHLVKTTNSTSAALLNTTAASARYSIRRHRLGCWIQEPMAALAAFGGPILVILWVNAIFYIKAIICIRSTTRSSINITRRSSHRRLTGQNDVIIYVRMSTVMGFTWIIGFTSSFISSVASDGGSIVCLVLRILTILFTLFNCSQGFLIFFVFVFNRRVGQLYKQFVLKKWLACKGVLRLRDGSSPHSGNETIARIS